MRYPELLDLLTTRLRAYREIQRVPTLSFYGQPLMIDAVALKGGMFLFRLSDVEGGRMAFRCSYAAAENILAELTQRLMTMQALVVRYS